MLSEPPVDEEEPEPDVENIENEEAKSGMYQPRIPTHSIWISGCVCNGRIAFPPPLLTFDSGINKGH